MLQWARQQPSPLICKKRMKQVLSEAFQDDLERRIFRRYLKSGRNEQKTTSWIHLTKVGAGGDEYVKLSESGIDRLDLIMHEMSGTLSNFEAALDELATNFPSQSRIQSEARFALGDLIRAFLDEHVTP